jgi:hypothetical protein
MTVQELRQRAVIAFAALALTNMVPLLFKQGDAGNALLLALWTGLAIHTAFAPVEAKKATR